MMRFEVLPGLPPYGPMAVSFTKNGATEHREGLVVRFYPKGSDPWVGNFLGGTTAYTVVLDHPNGPDVIIIAQGDVSIIDPERRTIHDWTAPDITAVIPVPSLRLVVFQGLTDFTAFGTDGPGWRSPRISWDGFRNIEVCETELLGEAYTPNGDDWAPFRLDLLTGHCTDGIYAQEMARAVPVRVRRADWRSAIRRFLSSFRNGGLGRLTRLTKLL
jgi:hypothetical protein